MKKFLLVVALLALISLPLIANAGPLTGALTKLGDAVKGTGLATDKGAPTLGLTDTVALIIKGVLSLVGTIFLILTVYAGILWMIAQGEEEKITKAKDILKAAIIGLFITMAAYAITFFVGSRLSGGTAPAPAPGAPTVIAPDAEGTSRPCYDAGGNCYATTACPSGKSKIGTCISRELCCK